MLNCCNSKQKPCPHEVRICPVRILPSDYPDTRKDAIVDDHHGTQIADPYRYLEKPDDPDTKVYVDELNVRTDNFIKESLSRGACESRSVDLRNSTLNKRSSSKVKHGAFFYYMHNSGLEDHDMMYQTKDKHDEGKAFLDPNDLSKDRTTILRQTSFSLDGSLCAYALSENCSNWMTIKFKSSSCQDLDDVIPNVKHSSISWMVDGSGIFYSKYPNRNISPEGPSTEKLEWHSLYFHKIGTKTEEDVLVYQAKDNPEMRVKGKATGDGRFLLISVKHGVELLYCFNLHLLTDYKITDTIEPVAVFKKEATYKYIYHDDDSMYILTNENAPMYKIIEYSLKDKTQRDFIPENPKAVLIWAYWMSKGRLLVEYIQDVKSCLHMHRKDGSHLYPINIPMDFLKFTGVNENDKEELLFSFTSFLEPNIVFKMECAGKPIEEELVVQMAPRDPIEWMGDTKFTVEQVFYKSKDGTRIPMYIIAKVGMQKDGKNPVILTGYGGFNRSRLPNFDISRLLFVRHFGGVYACANLRGGGEYGTEWHNKGIMEKKQNVFDDFIAGAEYLIEEKITTQEKLVIQGGSHGGLVVAVCSQMRPDLFACTIICHGVLDMLRYHKFKHGSMGLLEYGNPAVRKEYNCIKKYSPLHNLEIPGDGQWPPTLLVTGAMDDTVVPCHTLKYVATLHEKSRAHRDQRNPILARVYKTEGHGGESSIDNRNKADVDIYCFIQRVLGLEWIH